MTLPSTPLLGGLLSAGLLLLAGCASVGPDYRPPKEPLPAHWRNAPSAQTAKPGHLAQWWTRFKDPTLTRLITDALAHNPSLASAEAALRAARARIGIARAGLLPNLGGSAGAGHGNSSGAGHDQYQAGFDASWELDLFGGVRRGVQAARADYQAAGATLAAARVSLAAEVASDYVSLRGDQRRLAIARANLASQDETLQLTEWRVRAGLASAVDLEQAKTARAQTAARIPALQTSRRQSAYALAVLTGRPPGTLDAQLDRPAPLPVLPTGIAAGIPADTLRQRPDVRAAERTLAADTARIGVAQANLYPAFNLSGSLTAQAATLGALGSSGLVRSAIANISATLFDGGALRGQVAVQRALRDQALAAYRTTLLNALREVENALLALHNDTTEVQALSQAEQAARNAAVLAGQRYRAGLIDFQTVLDTERTRLSAEDSLASAHTQQLTDLIALYKALGGGWSIPTTKEASQ